MALPGIFSPTEPQASEPVATGPAKLQANFQALADFLGIPSNPTQITGAAFSITPGGAVTLVQPGTTLSADPTTALGAATKQYVDGKAIGVPTGVAGGTNTFAVSLTPAPVSLIALQGQPILVQFTNANTTASTLNPNTLGAVAITFRGAALSGAVILAGQYYILVYDGTNFELQADGAGLPTGVASGTNAYAVTLIPASASLAALVGQPVAVQFTNANTSAATATLNPNGFGATNMVKANGRLLNPGDIQANRYLILTYDGTNFQVQGGTSDSLLVYDRSVGNPGTHINNSGAETTIYTKSVPGNTIGTDGGLRITFLGNFINTVGTHNVEFKVKFGGTTVLDSSTTISFGANANGHMIKGVVELWNLGATNAQYVSGRITAQPVNITNGNMGNLLTGVPFDLVGEYVGLTVDTTTAQTLAVTATLDTNLGTLTYDSYVVYVEEIQP